MPRFRGYVFCRWCRALLLSGAFAGTAGAASAAVFDAEFLIAARTRLAGTGHDRATDLALDEQGNAWVAGVVGSYDFPGLSTAAIANGGMNMRYVARFDVLKNAPAFVVAVGGASASPNASRTTSFGRDEARGLAVDPSGNAYVVAHDVSRDYPVSGGIYRATRGSKYLFRVSPSGEVTRLPTELDAAIRRVGAIALDPSGNIVLTGTAGNGLVTSAGAPFPTSSVATGCVAPFVGKYDPLGQRLLFMSYLGVAGVSGRPCGGAVSAGAFDPTGFALAVDASGHVYVTGQAEPGLVATVGALNLPPEAPSVYMGAAAGPTATHAFVAMVDASGTALRWVARLGGSGWDRGTSIVVDAGGSVYVGGTTTSRDLQAASTFAPFPWVLSECMIATPAVGFVAKLSPGGGQLVFSGYVPAHDGQFDNCERDGEFAPLRIALDAAGNVVVAGRTGLLTRNVRPSGNALEPVQDGDQLLQVVAADGRGVAYSTSFAGAGVQGMARDRWGNVVVVDGRGLFNRLAPMRLPLDIAFEPALACADRALSARSRVAASFDAGIVTFRVDDVPVGTSVVRDGMARVDFTASTGVHRLRADYAGAGAFDGYASHTVLLPVNQAGSCP